MYFKEVFLVPILIIENYGLRKFGPVPSEPYKRRTSTRPIGKLYGFIINQLYQELPSPDSGSVDEAYRISVIPSLQQQNS